MQPCATFFAARKRFDIGELVPPASWAHLIGLGMSTNRPPPLCSILFDSAEALGPRHPHRPSLQGHPPTAHAGCSMPTRNASVHPALQATAGKTWSAIDSCHRCKVYPSFRSTLPFRFPTASTLRLSVSLCTRSRLLHLGALPLDLLPLVHALFLLVALIWVSCPLSLLRRFALNVKVAGNIALLL